MTMLSIAAASCGPSDAERLEQLRVRQAAAEIHVMYFERMQDSIYRSLPLEMSTDSVLAIMGPVTDSLSAARDSLALVQRDMNRFMSGR